MIRDLIVLVWYGTVAAVYVRPLFAHLSTRIALDAGDPALNAAVLAWNAKVLPFTAAWWNQPWFYPATGVTTFTENLVGLAPISTPIYWLTQNAVVTYNLTFFATWPLCAFAAYLLVRRVTGRMDAGILAGLAFGFTPYRASAALGHLQSLSAFWLPIALCALHGYVSDGRRRWLVLFGVAWILQALANGYYLLFGAVLVGLWLAYFGSTARTWKAGTRVIVVWAAATGALVPILLEYKQVHELYGLRRTFEEALAFSAHPDSWLQVSNLVAAWKDVLPTGREMLFPGLTIVLLVAISAGVGLSRSRTPRPAAWHRALLQAVLAAGTVASAAALLFWLAHGSWALRSGGQVLFRMTDPFRAMAVLVGCALPLLWLAPVRIALAKRHPFVFYAAVTPIMGLLACGPVLSVRDSVLLASSPYRWLMALPGFDELRVPSRFWMMGALCLSAAGAIGYAAITRRGRLATYAVFGMAAVGLLADGWLTALPTRPAPALWTSVRGTAPDLPLLELPLGPAWDAAATLRTSAHGRRVMNGVSGYEPPHYTALKTGLRDRDPDMLNAIASLGAYEISVEAGNDPDGRWKRYAAAAPGAAIVAEDADRTVFRVPALTVHEPVLGPGLPVLAVTASRGDPSATIDHRMDTVWGDAPQREDQWLRADLGRAVLVGGVSLAVADHPSGFPRRIAIDVSRDGVMFETVWESSGAPPAFLAVLQAPRRAWIRVAIPARLARAVRIRQLGSAAIGWIVPELEINAPPG